MDDRHAVGVVGARGHTGAELVRLIGAHPSLDLVFAGSREMAGEEVPGQDGLRFESMEPDLLAGREADVVVLALPDGAGDAYLAVVGPGTVVVDISADHRFDDAWVYGLPELFREKLRGASRIANPGCYATAAQIALAPLVDVVDGVPAVFGVSGYSGAGTTPGPRNDPELLADNLIPYKLVGHNHEREAVRYLGIPVRFMPHVHPAFRGLLVTAHVPLAEAITVDRLTARFTEAYGEEPLIQIKEEIPELREGAGHRGVILGGFETSADGRNAVIVAAEDNLLKGAAVQAVQNINLALGLPEFEGLIG
ncbi:MAG TPA: N-acetyl-gamma-glutamyl-phosphate reductase [Acidimicrobiia bacterium]|nr:N-acetyl-gamma-glutamyl-phosphate reductase [Acidimicrobiia bacterium]